MASRSLHLTVITPARSVFDGDAVSVVVPAFDGEMGVMAGHAPMMALLGSGSLRIKPEDGQTRRLAVRGGFLQVTRDKVTVLTPEAQAAGEIDAGKLDAEWEEIQGLKAVSEKEAEARARKIAWLKARRRALDAVSK